MTWIAWLTVMQATSCRSVSSQVSFQTPSTSYLISWIPYWEIFFSFLYSGNTHAAVCSSTLNIIFKMSIGALLWANLSPSVPDGPACCLKTYHRWVLAVRADGVISAFCLLSDSDMFNSFLQPWPLIIIAHPLQLLIQWGSWMFLSFE